MAILECRGLRKNYGKKTALDDVSFSVGEGRVLGLLGPNGSGKTTFIKLANGLLTPSGGEILIGGNKPSVETKKIISFLPERQYMPLWMTAEQIKRFYADFYADFDMEAADRMLDQLGIERKQKIKEMSKGTREKVQLILVMSRRAKLYLLDEPIGGVDPATRDYIIRTILNNRAPGSSVIISTHLIADVEPALDDVLFIQNGRISLQSTVEDIRADKGMSVDALFREVFRC